MSDFLRDYLTVVWFGAIALLLAAAILLPAAMALIGGLGFVQLECRDCPVDELLDPLCPRHP